MRIAIGSDHGGYELKENLKQWLAEKGFSVEDMGCHSLAAVDYPDYGLKVAEAVSRGEYDRGILLCGTGIGISIAANKVPGIRAALCHETFSAVASREHNDANILVMGGRVIGSGLARQITEFWLKTEFAGGRHARRVAKLTQIEKTYCGK